MTAPTSDARANAHAGSEPGKAAGKGQTSRAEAEHGVENEEGGSRFQCSEGRAENAQNGLTNDTLVRKKALRAPLIVVVKRPKGATLGDMMQATGWQKHSVRGFLSGALRKKLGLTIGSNKQDDGQRVYTIAG